MFELHGHRLGDTTLGNVTTLGVVVAARRTLITQPPGPICLRGLGLVMLRPPQNQQGFTFVHREVGFEPQLCVYHFHKSGIQIFVGGSSCVTVSFQDGIGLLSESTTRRPAGAFASTRSTPWSPQGVRTSQPDPGRHLHKVVRGEKKTVKRI